MEKSWKLWISVFVVVIICVTPLLTACGATTTTASMAFVVGNGTNDSKLRRIVYPGQTINAASDEVVSYVPANSRNYIINDGTVKNANGDLVGDRHTLIVAYTKTGVAIKIAARALWTLNQSEVTMRHFYDVSLKYQAASDKDISGDANFSTKGWNGMLAENFGPAMDTTARIAAKQVDDSIWQKHDPDQYKALGDGMSAVFAEEMRANLGYPEDLFCGSGNSTWSDPKNPGEGTFTCTPVRIVIDDVQLAQGQADQNSQGAITLNEQRLKNAQALYGPDAGYWLGLQDVIDKSKNAGTSFIINIGGASPMIPITGTNTTPAAPTPTPQETPTAEK